MSSSLCPNSIVANYQNTCNVAKGKEFEFWTFIASAGNSQSKKDNNKLE